MMADKEGGLPTNQSTANVSAADSKAMAEAMAKQAASYRENTAALEQYGRLSKAAREENRRMRDILLEDAKAAKDWGKQLFSLKGQYEDVKRSASGFSNELLRMGQLSSVYAAKLKYMREGQKSFTQSLVATTGNANKAMETSQKYVNAVHKSYANAHAIAGEFRAETQELERAVGQLSERFATQIAATSDMEGAMKGMQREAFIMGRYLGMEMSQVMDAWNDRMRASNQTLNEARKEFIAVAYQSDRYAKELAKLGDKILKTGNLGKKELVDMVQSVSKEMRTGILDAAAYSRALTDLMLKSKQAGYTTQEQMGVADTMKNLVKSMSDMSGPAGLFGLKAAEELMSAAATGQLKMQSAAGQARLDTIMKSGLAPIQKMQAMMEQGAGSAEFTALALGKLREATEGNKPILQEIAKTSAGGNQWLALQVAEQVANGEAEKAFDKKTQEEAASAEGGREKQVEVWKKGINDLVKSAHTPKDIDYKMIAEVEKIRETLVAFTKEFPLVMAGIQLGGSLLGGLGKWGAGKIATGAAAKLLGGAAPAALGAGGKIAPMAGLMGNAAPGVAAPAARGIGIGTRMLGLGSRALPILGRLAPILGPIGAAVGAGALVLYGADALDKHFLSAIEESGDVLKGSYKSYGDYLETRFRVGEENAKMYDHMTWIEKDKRFKVIAGLDKEIKGLEKNATILDETHKERLRQLKREKKVQEEALGGRVERRNVETGKVNYADQQEFQKFMLSRLQGMDTSAQDPTEFINKLLFSKIGGKVVGESDFKSFGEEMPQMIVDLMKVLPEEVKKKFGGNLQDVYASASEAVKRQQLRTDEYDPASGKFRGAKAQAKWQAGVDVMSQAEVTEAARLYKGIEIGQRADMSSLRDVATKQQLGQDQKLVIEMATATTDGGTVLDAITPNARGEISMPLGNLKFNISKFNDAGAKQKTKDSIGQ